jgi:hypothetical protein
MPTACGASSIGTDFAERRFEEHGDCMAYWLVYDAWDFIVTKEPLVVSAPDTNAGQ